MTRITLDLNMSHEAALIIIKAILNAFNAKLISLEVHNVPSKR
jgi:hypothetical protein